MTNNNFTKGFTLIETLMAVLLLSIAIVGPLTIAQKGLQTSLIAKDQSIAFNLAQDAVEFVRFARDTNCLAAGPGGCPPAKLNNSINLTPCVTTLGTNACYVDSYLNTVTTCSAVTCPSPINYDSTTNAYSYSGSATPTIFTRSVTIKYDNTCSSPCNPNEADLVVTVSWNDPINHSVTVRESLYNWQ
jgi:prepilin-type N-terminal cleavage/methylation domain-containing protein